ncbi:Gfo/Idh/MocA family protein [Paenibacillus thermoaerophilus]|uniref:Gfo/Idh/MocA family protein n=1 Tax=Paenibacillus thermoaerophilus TaxID=1215385 RepID=A0ABW2V1Y3_9BACL|nr:Gfo/Idh/MocA family oxidoreductase [Paenibacillus thermoaerophilus]TMV13970.1 Gfo/Idh/MocA family oxidoreductase [Paenibacillus thermoaerophilus]
MRVGEKIRVGVIGAGNIGNVHIIGFKSSPDFVVTAVTDAYLPLAKKRAEEHGIPHVYENADALIEADTTDAVVIAVSNEWHAPIAIKALRAGKHVMLEKPMAINLQAAKDIVRAQRETGLTLMIPHQMRWEWAAQEIKKQSEKGAFGRIYNIKCGWMRRKGIPGWGTWFTQMAKSGGGPLIDIGVHLLDLSLYLAGNPKPVSVTGAVYSEIGPKKKGIGNWGTPDWNGRYDVEDSATAIVRMEDGSVLNLDVSWAVHMDTDSKPYVHLLGSEGGASLRGGEGTLLAELYDRAVDIPLERPEVVEDSRQQLNRHFAECIREGKEPITNAMTGLANNLILDAIYESSRTGREVQLDWSL